MSLVDIIVLIVTILIVLSIIFFSFIKPKLEGKKVTCASCPASKKGKRLIKKYRKEQSKKLSSFENK